MGYYNSGPAPVGLVREPTKEEDNTKGKEAAYGRQRISLNATKPQSNDNRWCICRQR